AIGLWHLWQDGNVYLLTGGIEQPAPAGLETGATAHVTARAKGKNARVLAFEVSVDTLTPESEDWRTIAAALVPKRLNLPDGEAAPERWARECTLWRLQPTGVIFETAQEPTTVSHAAAPPPSPARTRVPRPLHLRALCDLVRRHAVARHEPGGDQPDAQTKGSRADCRILRHPDTGGEHTRVRAAVVPREH